jgi:hypothetical protein
MRTTKQKLKIVERRLGREKAWGLCYSDDLIEIDPRQSAKQFVATAIHELLHHLLPSESEKKITKMEHVMIDELWKLGVRLLAK